MKEWVKSLYWKLPVIRELKRLSHFQGQAAAATLLQALETIKARSPHYADPRRLLAYGAQYWSQNFEDGMIEEIFRRVPPVTRTFLEIGVGDGSENNTTSLLAAGWSGWWIEGNPKACDSIRRELQAMPRSKERLTLKQSFVSPSNINGLLAELKVPREVDLFSLDIDLDTYHIWAALKEFRPRVVVVEYNAAISPSLAWVAPWKENCVWDSTQFLGASLKAYEKLGVTYGYSLVGCDLTGLNAFFVRDDLVGDHFAAPFTAENHYEPLRYHLTFRHGHRSKFFGESHPL